MTSTSGKLVRKKMQDEEIVATWGMGDQYVGPR